TGAAPMENAVVVIEGERIKSVFRAGEKRLPARARVIDAAGKTLLPGLIDAHVHTAGSAGARISEIEYTPWRQRRDLKAYLYSGVTTIKSLGDDQTNTLELREQERTGKLVSPRIFTVGKVFTAPGGHPAATTFAQAPSFVVEGGVNQVDSEEAARAVVRAQAAARVDGIKAILEGGTAARPLPKLKSEILQAVIAEAHQAKLKVSVHCDTAQDVKDAVLSGANGIEHADQDNLPDETLKLMAERGVFYTPTLVVFDATYQRFKTGVDAEDPLTRASVIPEILDGLKLMRTKMNEKAAKEGADQWLERLEVARGNARRASAFGVRIVAGSDAGNQAIFHGPGLHREMALLTEAGLTPLAAITAATGNAAAYLGASDRLGSIQPGKLADLLIVDGDPSTDISVTKKIWMVIKGGREIDRQNIFVEPPIQAVVPAQPLADDFEDGDLFNKWKGRWIAVDDRVAGGSSDSKVEVAAGGYGNSRYALKISGRVTNKFQWGPFAGAVVSLGKDEETFFDLSKFTGLLFYAKGGEDKPYKIAFPIAAVKDHDDFFQEVTIGTDWQLVKIPFSALKQGGFGKRVDWNAREVKSLSFYTSGGPRDSFELYLDDISFYK
ncbi:MAG TPA: CIA30 family protein, partial [Pyrinomonadaceae bacterium]|nr:CIA30 family protein [Pyrinomonadaceae bacterium]